ncbi:MAG TPA: hypothetical protein VFX39_02325, partial [Gemmatimonadaceae bacterium]|nr:hypothetical protein [Gemmatimonadaceae bacterium]
IVSSIVTLGSPLTVNATDASRGWELNNQRTYTYTPPSRPFLGIGNVFGYQNVDLRVEKPIRLANGQSVSIVADGFNIFNNANYGCYDATIFPTSGDPNTNYGRPGCAGLGWRLQLGARWNYNGRPLLDQGGNGDTR